MTQTLDDLLLHPKLRYLLDDFLRSPSQGLMISGPAGSGKKYLAKYLSSYLLGVEIDKLTNHPFYIVISRPADKQEISIDTIREIIHRLALKTPGLTQNAVTQVVVVEDAQYLSREAQNALLKSLEEPPYGTMFILTVPSALDILPTVASRLRHVIVPSLSIADAIDYFRSEKSQNDIVSAWTLSQGGAGLISALLDDSDHPLSEAVRAAKQFVAADTFQRLVFIDKLGNSRSDIGLFLEALGRVLAALQQQAIKRGKPRQSKVILRSRQLVNESLEALMTNTSVRLINLNLAVNLKL
ncbi:MAG TPA: hypothetical protein VFP32_03465 [Candidatus Saccharimonadales bacterium]|nr:hypothetical protein [Candidatus Saccharimonadales bacterium]